MSCLGANVRGRGTDTPMIGSDALELEGVQPLFSPYSVPAVLIA
jgi:hypothetical protein